MVEQIDIGTLRRVLKEHPGRPRHLPAEQRRSAAADAIERVVDAIERGIWPIRHWERYYLATAVRYIHLGLYDAAFDQAEMAILPDDLRATAPYRPAPEMPPFPPEDVRRDLELALKESPLIEIHRIQPLAPPTLREKLLAMLRNALPRTRS